MGSDQQFIEHIMLTDNPIKVSVSIITYNHESFIEKALNSILMQETNFNYEIIIGEDCSTDNTRSILIDYQKRNPDKIHLLLHQQNLGMHINGNRTLQACKGYYVAMLEGDDYWTSKDKLQKQVDFLDDHPDCSVCFHDALIVHQDGSQEPIHYRPSQKEFSTVVDLLFDNFIPTCSVMFRRHLFKKVPDWITTLKMGDWPFYILMAQQGKIGYINQTMSVYVVHRGGVWSMKEQPDHDRAIIDLFETLSLHLNPEYQGIINRILRSKYIVKAEQLEHKGKLTCARINLMKSFKTHFRILGEPFGYRRMMESKWNDSIPDYLKSFKFSRLLKCFLRVHLVTALELYLPPMYKLSRKIARRLKLDLNQVVLRIKPPSPAL